VRMGYGSFGRRAVHAEPPPQQDRPTGSPGTLLARRMVIIRHRWHLLHQASPRKDGASCRIGHAFAGLRSCRRWAGLPTAAGGRT
jgi:hypothetical protein